MEIGLGEASPKAKAALFRLNHGHRKFVDLTIDHGDFPVRYVSSFTRGYMIYPDFWKRLGIFICKSWPQGFKGGQFMIFSSYLFNVTPGNWAGEQPWKLRKILKVGKLGN